MVQHRIAYFISPHGLGHAARAAAVMAALQEIDAAIHFEIFTRVPLRFFEDSLPGPFHYHSLLTDIGVVQKTPLTEDLDRTLERLNAFLPLNRSKVSRLARRINRLGCELVICDISPMGIAVAREADIPSVLVENFTWDWIYEGYARVNARLRRHVPYLRKLFDAADHHVQTEPVCLSRVSDLVTEPVGRKVRTPAKEIRGELGLASDSKAVIITMGGIRGQHFSYHHMKGQNDVNFVIPGGSEVIETHGNLVLLPHHSNLFYPDLINASDAVVGKIGYSTLAEAYYTGVPFGYISRTRFRESQILADYLEKNMFGFAIEEEEFQDGSWVSHLQALLALPRAPRKGPNGADQVAHFILTLLNRQGMSASL
jgi:UDP:flavonoid glycosyltransferase YjiC (YdhE family)